MPESCRCNYYMRIFTNTPKLTLESDASCIDPIWGPVNANCPRGPARLSAGLHLRARTSTDFLIAQLRRCQYSLESTKKRIDEFFTFIAKFREITAKRQVSEKILSINRLGVQYYLESPSQSDHSAIMNTRFGGYCSLRYHMREIMAYTTMAMELIALETDNAALVGVCDILDLSNMNMEHTSQMSADNFKLWWHWVNNCSPLRINKVYCLNAPKGLQNVLNVLQKLGVSRGIFPPWIFIKSLEELYRYVPQQCLPEEFGGINGHKHEFISYMDDLLKSYRDYFEDEINYGTVEELRRGVTQIYKAEFGADSSFRKLIVD